MTHILTLRSNSFILSILFLQIIVFFVIYADIPIARMAICFLYLLFVPGIVILKLLALKTLDISEKILFSVGLSIAFLMLVGVAVNELGKLIITNPLSLNVLILSINPILLLLAFVSSRRTDSRSPITSQLKLSSRLFLILVTISLFLLGSYGIFTVRYSEGNFFILLLIIAIAVLVSLVFLNERIIPPNHYPLVLLLISVCLLVFVWASLATPYITGTGDQWLEYYSFRTTGQLWNSQLPETFAFYSMISVTILPAIFSTITAMDNSFLFNLLYPIIASFVALGAYKLYQTQTDNKTAFLATFFLITITVGKGMGPARQEIAELFFVLLFLILLKKEIAPLKRNILLIIFGTGLVLSHYSLTYIFLLAMIASFLIFVFLDYSKSGRVSISQVKIPLTFVIVFSIITFSWYIYTNGSAAFTPLIQTITTVTTNLNQFFDPASRGTALEGLGVVQTPTIYSQISSVLFILTEFLLVIGFIKLMTSKKPARFSIEYKVFATLNLAIIAINILLPRIADTFLMARFYQVTMIMLAPLAVIGGKAIFELILKNRFQKFYIVILVFLVFIPLFMFQTQFVYEVTGDQSYSLTLSMYRWTPVSLYDYTVSAQEVIGAQWIPQYANSSGIIVYSDYTSLSNVLKAYGLIRGLYIYDLLGTLRITSNAVTYISDVALINEGYLLNATLVSSLIENQNKIYSNGQCEIYEGCAP